MATATAERPTRTAARMLSRRILVTVDQGMSIKTPKLCWQHEMPLLQELHGEEAVEQVQDPVQFLDKDWKPKQSLADLHHNKRQDDLTRPSVAAGLGFVFLGEGEAEWQRLSAAFGRCLDENVLVVERIYGRAKDGRLSAMLGQPTLEDLPEAQLRQLIVGTGYVTDISHDTPAEEKPAILAQRAAWLKLDRAGLIALAEEQGVEFA